MFKNFLASITRNGISMAGTAIALASLILIVSLFFIQQLGYEGGPYLGILTFLILPALCVIGLLMIPVGSLLWRRRMQNVPGGEDMPILPVFDLNNPHTRRWLLIFTGITTINIVVLAGATYKGVEEMESVEFCGLACHSVMEPEYTAHERSPHSRVACADCHIGPGANWFVKSKLDGTWQLIAVAFNLYPRPIPTPLHDLRPARETCEQCHWPTKFVGDRLVIKKHYAEDETNTELTTALLLRVGGGDPDESEGIHWHVDPSVTIRYRSDESREDIYDVEFTDGDGKQTQFSDRKAPEEGGVWRTMDCVDCHNRPTHIYKPAADEVDRVISEGLVDRSLPFVRREGLRIIDARYTSHEEARAQISEQLAQFYAENYPDIAEKDADKIAAAGKALGDAYSVNVFPGMNVWWDTYPNHIGHDQSPGCFRCHNRKMRSEDRKQIPNDCDTCHVILAEKEEHPQILSALSSE